MARIKIDLPEKFIAKFFIPVRITDINYGNHVGNDSLVAIVHESRMQFLGQYNYTEMNVAGTSLIMSELLVEYKNEAFYGDLIEVKIFAGDITRVGFELYYSLSVERNKNIIIIANVKTGIVCYNYSLKKVERVPEKLIEIINA